MAPLNSLLQGIPAGRNANLSWNEEASTAFEDIKVALSNATLLNFPQHDSPTALFVDASDKFCGAVLSQIDSSGSHRPLEYFSAAFSDAQKRYSTFDKELLAAYLAVHHFTYFLEGRPFTLYTDHKPLVGAISRKKTPLSNRQARHLSFISEFTTDVRHIEGKNNVVADCLSRPQITAALSPSFTDYTELVLAQRDDPSIRELFQSMTSLKLCERAIPNSGLLLLGDTSTGKFRPIIPNSLRTTIFERMHNLSHPGIKATQKLIGERFVWPNMRRDIADKCRTCISCQQTKITRHQITPLQHFRTPDARFSHVHVDIVGPLPDSSGYKYLLTVVDRFTRWPEAIPMKDITAQSCADSFLLHWVARFGSPTIITTDRGAQFTSLLWTEMCQFLGSKLCHTTAFHPAANGLNERFNRSLKVALKCQSSPDLWYRNLSLVLLGLRSAIKEDMGCAAVEMALGTSIRLPGDYFENSIPVELSEESTVQPASQYAKTLCSFMNTLRYTMPRHPKKQQTYVDPLLSLCSQVFVRIDSVKSPLQRPYSGPHFVLERHDKYFVIEKDGHTDTVSIDRLKPAFVEPISPIGSSVEEESAETRSFSPTSSSENGDIFAEDLDELPANRVYSRRGRLITKPIRYRD